MCIINMRMTHLRKIKQISTCEFGCFHDTNIATCVKMTKAVGHICPTADWRIFLNFLYYCPAVPAAPAHPRCNNQFSYLQKRGHIGWNTENPVFLTQILCMNNISLTNSLFVFLAEITQRGSRVAFT